jgi:hypothetical protein
MDRRQPDFAAKSRGGASAEFIEDTIAQDANVKATRDALSESPSLPPAQRQISCFTNMTAGDASPPVGAENGSKIES